MGRRAAPTRGPRGGGPTRAGAVSFASAGHREPKERSERDETANEQPASQAIGRREASSSCATCGERTADGQGEDDDDRVHRVEPVRGCGAEDEEDQARDGVEQGQRDGDEHEPIDDRARYPGPERGRSGEHEQRKDEPDERDGQDSVDGAQRGHEFRHRSDGTAALSVAMRTGAAARGGLLSLGAVAGVVALTLGLGHATPSTAAEPTASAAGAGVVDAGRGLYVANCATCHGPTGQGTPAGPPLTNAGAAATDFYLRTGRMPLSAPGQAAVRQPPHFDEQQIRDLVAYVASLGQGPGIAQVAGGGDIGKGAQLYTANCAACHSVTGAGNAIGGGFVAVGLGQAGPHTIGEATIIGPGAMPVFNLSQADLSNLVAYIEWLRTAPTPGGAAVAGTGPVAEGFVAVAVGLPILVLVSLFVARRPPLPSRLRGGGKSVPVTQGPGGTARPLDTAGPATSQDSEPTP